MQLIEHDINHVLAAYGDLIMCPDEFNKLGLINMIRQNVKSRSHRTNMTAVNVSAQFLMICRMIDEGLIANPTPITKQNSHEK